MSTNLVMCADDYGRSIEIDDAILELAGLRRLSAVTVMVAELNLWRSAQPLKRSEAVEIGLHVSLTIDDQARGAGTCSAGFEPMHIDRLTGLALRRRLPLESLAQEIDAQFKEFQRVFGHPPHFVDGHQHCHVLPGIRGIVLKSAADHAPQCWTRSCEDSPSSILRRGGDRGRALRAAVLSHGLRRDARSMGLQVNDSFAGLYDLRETHGLSRRFSRFLDRATGSNHLVICHPSHSGDGRDPIGATRAAEFEFLRHAPIHLMAAERSLKLGTFR